MWQSGSKCQRIGALVKVNCKQLKADLAIGVKKLGPLSLALKLGKFPLFGGFFDFPNLENFWDLANFFDFLDFLTCSTPSSPNLSTSPLPLFFSEAGLLPLFLLETDLLPLFFLEAGLLHLFLLKTGSLGDPVIFNIEVSGATILLKLWMNRW